LTFGQIDGVTGEIARVDGLVASPVQIRERN
jgi:hypothetical protein